MLRERAGLVHAPEWEQQGLAAIPRPEREAISQNWRGWGSVLERDLRHVTVGYRVTQGQNDPASLGLMSAECVWEPEDKGTMILLRFSWLGQGGDWSLWITGADGSCLAGQRTCSLTEPFLGIWDMVLSYEGEREASGFPKQWSWRGGVEERYRAFDVVICLGNPYTQDLTFRSART